MQNTQYDSHVWTLHVSRPSHITCMMHMKWGGIYSVGAILLSHTQSPQKCNNKKLKTRSCQALFMALYLKHKNPPWFHCDRKAHPNCRQLNNHSAGIPNQRVLGNRSNSNTGAGAFCVRGWQVRILNLAAAETHCCWGNCWNIKNMQRTTLNKRWTIEQFRGEWVNCPAVSPGGDVKNLTNWTKSGWIQTYCM